MTIAQKLAWKRFGLTLLGTASAAAVPVTVELLSDPDTIAALGISSGTAAVIVAIVAALLKLRKENGKGLNYPG